MIIFSNPNELPDITCFRKQWPHSGRRESSLQELEALHTFLTWLHHPARRCGGQVFTFPAQEGPESSTDQSKVT